MYLYHYLSRRRWNIPPLSIPPSSLPLPPNSGRSGPIPFPFKSCPCSCSFGSSRGKTTSVYVTARGFKFHFHIILPPLNVNMRYFPLKWNSSAGTWKIDILGVELFVQGIYGNINSEIAWMCKHDKPGGPDSSEYFLGYYKQGKKAHRSALHTNLV